MRRCFAQRVALELAPGEARSLCFLLGEAGSQAEARALLERLRAPGAVERALREVQGFWRDTLSAVQVETPVPALDLVLNGWLAYQNLSCRIWGRSAFYQSGGAYGYRDQLQDAAALVYTGRASRDGSADFVALMSSLYVRRDGRWRLALYQQTPVPSAG